MTMKYRPIESVDDEMKALKEIIEEQFEIDNLFRNTRRREYVDARMIYSKILKDRGHSVSSIGRFLGKNHATVIHYVCNAEFLIRQEAKLRERYANSRSTFFEYRDPVYKTPTQRDLMNKVISLMNQIEILEDQKREIDSDELRIKRFRPIITLLEERLPEGKEDFLEQKIKRILNDINDKP